MVHREPRHHGIEAGVGKGQLDRIALAEGDVGKAGRGTALRRLFQHFRGEIERHYLARGCCDRRAEDAGTAGDVEHRALRRLVQRRDETLRQRRIGDRRRRRKCLSLPGEFLANAIFVIQHASLPRRDHFPSAS